MALLLEDFDVEAILAPIPGDAPCGADPREDVSANSIYFRLRDARAEARELERQSEASGTDDRAPPLPWRTVRSLATTGLSQNAKDLEFASWLTEALVRASGLRGLGTGAAVVQGLLDRYWDGLYPTPDEDGIETRIAPLAGLAGQSADGTLMQPLRKMTLFNRPDGTPFGFWQYELSVELSGITDATRRQQRLDLGVVPFDDLEKEARMAGSPHWVTLAAEITGALASWDAMTASLDERAGALSPSTRRVRDLLVVMESVAARFTPGGGAVAAPVAQPGAAATPGVGIATAAAPAPTPGGIDGREEALRQLGDIAAWFKRHEPNSPLAYTLDEAVRRGRMSWPDLIAEVMPDATGRHALLNTLGIKPAAD